jgi:nucleoside 2-deoxyribosyltransferase
MRPIRASISGSFHRDPEKLKELYDELIVTSCQVLSPFSPVFDDKSKDFVSNDTEDILHPDELERRHLAAINHSDLLVLHLPDGYIGLSTAFELGYAYAKGVPIVSKEIPKELVFQPIVHQVNSVFEGLQVAQLIQ